jgi:hypothetical protein
VLLRFYYVVIDVLTCLLLQGAEFNDLPVSVYLMFQFYKNILLSGVPLLKEFFFFTDIFPTATTGWVLQYNMIYMFPSVHTYLHSIHFIHIPFSLSPYLLVYFIFVFLSVKVVLSVSSSDVFDNSDKRNPLYLSGSLYMFCYRFIHPSCIL